MLPDVLDRFTLPADLYARYRPDYPSALLDWILGLAPTPAGARVVDLGCGTGIASRLFAERGLRVAGADGNLAMLRHAAATGGGPVYVRAEASRLPFGGASADLVVAAQAFHWFDEVPTLREIERVLRPGCFGAAFWNRRAPGAFADAYEALLHRFAGDYPRAGGRGGEERLRAALAGRPFREASFARVVALDWEHLRGRAHSASYVAHGVDADAFDAALRQAFDQHQREGRVEMPLDTVALAWPRA